MASSRAMSRERRPESILASEADKRVTTAEGRPRTSETSLGVPENTPRDLIVITPSDVNDDLHALSPSPEGGAHPGSERPEDILDTDELFMTLSEEERKEWEAMMAERSSQMEKSFEEHKKWADSFTRRRMFAYSRMRKLTQCFQDRRAMLTTVAENLQRLRPTVSASNIQTGKKAELEKRYSDSAMVPSKSNKSMPGTSIRRNETMLGMKKYPTEVKEPLRGQGKPDTLSSESPIDQQCQANGEAEVTDNAGVANTSNSTTAPSLTKLSENEDTTSDSDLVTAGDKVSPREKSFFLKVKPLQAS